MDWLFELLISLVFFLVRTAVHGAQLFRGREWRVMDGTVLSATFEDTFGCPIVTIIYEYPINGERYGAWSGLPFILKGSAKKYASKMTKGAAVKVRVKPSDPTVAVLIKNLLR